MKVRDCMCTELSCVGPEATLGEIAKIMQEKHVGCIPVCDTNKKIVGLVTDRDLVLRGMACNKDANTTPVSEIMTTKVHTITPNEDVNNATKTMCDCQVRRIPVIDNEIMVGIITLADIANNNDKQQVGETAQGICRCGQHTKNDQ